MILIVTCIELSFCSTIEGNDGDELIFAQVVSVFSFETTVQHLKYYISNELISNRYFVTAKKTLKGI